MLKTVKRKAQKQAFRMAPKRSLTEKSALRISEKHALYMMNKVSVQTIMAGPVSLHTLKNV